MATVATHPAQVCLMAEVQPRHSPCRKASYVDGAVLLALWYVGVWALQAGRLWELRIVAFADADKPYAASFKGVLVSIYES